MCFNLSPDMNHQKTNNHSEEGYIKFECHWTDTPPVIPPELFKALNDARQEMYNKGLIGCYENGIGFGNISIRDTGQPQRFYISGSATGSIAEGTPREYARVEGWEIEANTLWCTGPVKASSESMSHAVIYETMPEVGCIIHIHSMSLWQRAIRELPCTLAGVSYGTPEMAYDIKALILEHNMTRKGALAMKGHEEGIIVFGKDPREALEVYARWGEEKGLVFDDFDNV
jgi:L-ribulose-5-phosphate 4-epimerase